MASTRGFSQVHLIKKSIHELYRAFGPKHIESFNQNFRFDSSEFGATRDPVVETQYLARKIADHYRLPVTTVVVTFSSTLKPPGRVELSNSNEFFVELQMQYRSAPKVIAAVLAHEIAHIFLHRCGVGFSVEIENEILTDTTAVFVGFGPTILNAVLRNSRKLQDGAIQTRTEHFGYLSLDEFGYALARRDKIYRAESYDTLDSGLPRVCYFDGRDRYLKELRIRPLIKRPWPQRFLAPVLKKWRSSESARRSISFACPICSQMLRVPELHRTIVVNCSNCASRFRCHS
jgi:hypothetical protein